MNKIITLGLSLSALLVATSAAAQDGNTTTDTGAYANLGVSLVDVDSEIAGVVVRLGYNATQYFGIEGGASTGLNTETDEGVKYKFETQFAGFGVARFPVGEKASIFGRVGYQSTKIRARARSRSVADNFDGIALGLGGNYMFSGKNGVRVDYTRYSLGAEGESVTSDTFSAAYVRKF